MHCACCGTPLPLEQAHVVPWSKSKEHSVKNLIALCANCHSRADKEKWGSKTLAKYKKNPFILAHKANAPEGTNAHLVELLEVLIAGKLEEIKERSLEMASMIDSAHTQATGDVEGLDGLGLLRDLAGTWHGTGFNLIARQDENGNASLFLELNQTQESLSFDPIAKFFSSLGNSHYDVKLFGLEYVHEISNSVTGGAPHIESGIWINIPETDAPAKTQSVTRMATTQHGDVAAGTAFPVNLTGSGGTFMIAPVNTSPFLQGTPIPAGGTQGGFPEYDLSNRSPEANNSRTPFGDAPFIRLPSSINGVAMQTVVHDPTRFLQQNLEGQFVREMVVLEISTQSKLRIPVFATFWIEKIKHRGHHFLQLQYVQTILLKFPLLSAGEPPVDLYWPQVSVATLRKTSVCR